MIENAAAQGGSSDKLTDKARLQPEGAMIEDAAIQGANSYNIADKGSLRQLEVVKKLQSKPVVNVTTAERANNDKESQQTSAAGRTIVETREKQTDVGKFVHFE